MLSIVLDPGHDYPAWMIEFLASKGRGFLAVFTNEGQMAAYEHLYADRLDPYMVDAYLLPEWGDYRSLAADILGRWGGALEGILPWDEHSVEVGATLGEWLGLDWNSHEVIRGFRDKFLMKDRLRAWGDVRINASWLVRGAGDVHDFLHHVDHWPVVVKPTRGSGTWGVTFAWSWDELLEGCQQVTDAGSDVVLEEYVDGTEFVVNGIADADADLLVTDVWAYDKQSLGGSRALYYDTHKVSTSNPVFWPLAEYAGRVVERLGLRRAPIHMELKMDAFGPCLIEVGARLSGGGLPILASALHGRSVFDLAACHYMAALPARAEDLDYGRYDSGDARVVSGIQPYTIPEVSAVHGLDAVRSLPSFHHMDLIKPPGSYLPQTTDMFSRNYEVYLVHPDAAQVSHDAAMVRELLYYT